MITYEIKSTQNKLFHRNATFLNKQFVFRKYALENHYLFFAAKNEKKGFLLQRMNVSKMRKTRKK